MTQIKLTYEYYLSVPDDVSPSLVMGEFIANNGNTMPDVIVVEIFEESEDNTVTYQ